MENHPDSKITTKSSKKKDIASSTQPDTPEDRTYRVIADKSENQSTEPEPGLYEYLKALSPDKKLPKEAPESVAPTDHLGDEEKRLASSEVTKERLVELASQAESVEPGSPEAKATEGSQLYMTNLYSKLNKFQPRKLTAEESIDMAAEETTQQLSAAKDASLPPLTPYERTHEFGLPFEPTPPSDGSVEAPLQFTAPNSAEGDDFLNSIPSSTEADVPDDAILDTSGGGGGSGGPNIPNIPVSFDLPPSPDPNKYLPNSAVYNTGRSAVEHTPNNEGGMFVLGVIVGYFIGRRRGRIKTEERLKPIQKNLENEVRSLSKRIAARETEIRHLAYVKASQEKLLKEQSDQKAGQYTQSLATKLEQPATEKTPDAIPAAIGSQVLMQEAIPKSRIHSEQAIDQSQMLKSSEKPSPQTEQPASREVLDLSQTIKVDGVSLREMYNNHQIDDKGLRLLVSEHLAGGNVSKVLNRELQKKQPNRSPEATLPEVMSRSDSGSSPLNSHSPSQQLSEAASVDTQTALSGGLQSPSPAYKSNLLTPQQEAKSRSSSIVVIAIIIVILTSIIFWIVR